MLYKVLGYVAQSRKREGTFTAESACALDEFVALHSVLITQQLSFGQPRTRRAVGQVRQSYILISMAAEQQCAGQADLVRQIVTVARMFALNRVSVLCPLALSLSAGTYLRAIALSVCWPALSSALSVPCSIAS